MHAITKIQLELQQSSVKLVSTILENTKNVHLKLENLIKVYKDLLENGLIDEDIATKEIVSNYQENEALPKALMNHFSQTLVSEDLTFRTKIKKAKQAVSELQKISNMSQIYSMIVSSDESFLVIGEINGYIRVYDLKTFLQTCSLEKHKEVVCSLALGSENQLMLSGSHDWTVRLWDMKTKIIFVNSKGMKVFIRSFNWAR